MLYFDIVLGYAQLKLECVLASQCHICNALSSSSNLYQWEFIPEWYGGSNNVVDLPKYCESK